MRVVLNTSPFIALGRIGQLDLLRGLFGQVVRPEAVLAELLAGSGRYGELDSLSDAEWVRTESDPPEMVLRKELGAGETAAITLAYQSEADLVVLDDFQARIVAEGLGLKVTGTLGILLAAHREGLLPDLAGALNSLRESGFRIAPELVAAVLREGGK